MYRREEGSFAQLPLVTRAIAAEILKLTNDDGVISVGDRAPWEAVCFALGATRGDRRVVKRAMEELLSDGYVIHDGQTLTVPNFPRFQGATTEPRPDPEATTTVQRRSTDRATTEPRPDHDRATKGELSARDVSTPENTVEKRREEKTTPNPTVVSAFSSDVSLIWGELRDRRGFPPETRPRPHDVRRFAEWCADAVPRLGHELATTLEHNPGMSPVECVARMTMVRFLEDQSDPKLVAARHPFSWLVARAAQYYPEVAA